MKTFLIIILAFVLMSCKPQIATNYKVVTRERNYYTDKLTYVNDSIMFFEKNRKGKPKAAFAIPYKDTEIITSK